MRNFALLYSDTILKKIIIKINRDTKSKDKNEQTRTDNTTSGKSVLTQRHWKAAANAEFYYKEIVEGYKQMSDLDKLTNWRNKLNQERFGFLKKYPDILKRYEDFYKEDDVK